MVVVTLGAVLSLGGAQAWAAPVEEHRELRFATELLNRGFDELAVEQLNRVRRMDFLPDSVRSEATIRLARLYQRLGEIAEAKGDNPGKSRYFEKAVVQYTDYMERIGERAGKEEMMKLVLARSALLESLGADRVLAFQLTVDPQEREEHREAARKWLTAAEADLKEASEFLLKLRDALRDTAKTEADRLRFQEIRELAGEALLRLGQTKYNLSRVFEVPQDRENRDKKLGEAIEVFQRVAEEYSIFGVLHIRRPVYGGALRGAVLQGYGGL